MKDPRANDNRFHHLVTGVVELSYFRDDGKLQNKLMMKKLARYAKQRRVTQKELNYISPN